MAANCLDKGAQEEVMDVHPGHVFKRRATRPSDDVQATTSINDLKLSVGEQRTPAANDPASNLRAHPKERRPLNLSGEFVVNGHPNASAKETNRSTSGPALG
jgi:hypothetical protein